MYHQNDFLPVYISTSFHQEHTKRHDFSARSNKSSKCSSRKGSTDNDSRLKFKTESCRYWLNEIECPYGQNCNFAHGGMQVRAKDNLPSKYKTRKCNKFNEQGFCSYGYRCQFIHCHHQKPRVSHEMVLECLTTDSTQFFSFLEENQKNLGRGGRLYVFERICRMGKSSHQNYLGEIVYQQDDEYQNYVDVRSRHNSF